MVKIGRSLAGPSGDSSGKEFGGKKARPASSSVSPESQAVKELITVALVRKGFDMQSDTRRILNIAGDKTFKEFRSIVCESLDLSDSYPVHLTVVGSLSPITAGTRMSTLYQEASLGSDFDGVLYVKH